MNKFLFITKPFVIILAMMFTTQAEAHVHSAMEKWYKAPKVALTSNLLEMRLDKIPSDVDLRVTGEVERRVKEYTVNYTASTEKILGRVMLYFPIFEAEIEKRGLPEELKYVAIIESLLRPEGTSRSGAAGLWQIMKRTGRMLGLEVSSKIDERRDPIKSTKAALDYLEQLHDQFGDWTIAIAAYNCGPGSMRKAIRRGGGVKDYWQIRNHLPKETQKYIPRFVAASYLMNYYHIHGLAPNMPASELRSTKEVNTDAIVSLTTIEKDLDINKGLLKKLNPSFINNVIPQSTNQIVIPSKYFESFLKVYEPARYDLLVMEREKQEQPKFQLKIEPQRFVALDSLKQFEYIVSSFISQLNILERKRYNIPIAMRSNLSYLQA